MQKVVIDCDPGVDDAAALLWAMAETAALDLAGITVVAGNVTLDWTSSNARRLVTLGGRHDVPVHAGCSRPMVLALESAAHIHGEDGLDGAELPLPGVDLAAGHGVDRLIDLAHAHDDLTICAIGPLTNLAMALVKEPSIAERLGRVVLMGGSIGLGNVTASAEFNIYVDPHAAKVVFESGVPIVMLGLDVTTQVRPTPARLEALRNLKTSAGSALAGMLALYASRASDGGALHDPLAVAYLLMPEAFAGRDCHVEVVTDGVCRGRTVVDAAGRGGRTANALVLDQVDGDAVFQRLLDAMARLP